LSQASRRLTSGTIVVVQRGRRIERAHPAALIGLACAIVMALIWVADWLFVSSDEGANIGLGMAGLVLYPSAFVACLMGIDSARGGPRLASTVGASALSAVLLAAPFALYAFS
jgi:hypothetical protein